MIRYEFTEHREDGSTLHTEVYVREDGGLTLAVHDLGPVTAAVSHSGEYEARFAWSSGQTAAIVAALGGTPDEPLDQVLERWGDRITGIYPALIDAGIEPVDRWSWP